MRIRTRAFLLGLLPALLLATVLTAYHAYSRLTELEDTVNQQGMALARHLAASAEYGVLSGNRKDLLKLLDDAINEPGVKSTLLVWPDGTRLARGEPAGKMPPLNQAGLWQTGERSWFAYPVML
ncbi:MAG: hypothetical protein HXY27_05825, partial [Hydrogenophilaceae bacterium]|nr:hypothetical protein [Hydrogenophilaceae bacterium]